MLYISPFEFIVRHFFWLLFAVMVISFVNGMFLFPVLLSFIGPAAELIPLEFPDRISTLSPIGHRSKRGGGDRGDGAGGNNAKNYVLNNRSSASSSSSSSRNKHQHHQSKASLTTITEEPQSWKSSNASISTNSGSMDYNLLNNGSCGSGVTNSNSKNANRNNSGHYKNCNAKDCGVSAATAAHESSSSSQSAAGNEHNLLHMEMKSIVVQPEVTVETTTNGSDQNSTKVTATANIRVELVTPRMNGGQQTYQHCSR